MNVNLTKLLSAKRDRGMGNVGDFVLTLGGMVRNIGTAQNVWDFMVARDRLMFHAIVWTEDSQTFRQIVVRQGCADAELIRGIGRPMRDPVKLNIATYSPAQKGETRKVSQRGDSNRRTIKAGRIVALKIQGEYFLTNFGIETLAPLL